MLKTITPFDSFEWTQVHDMTPADRKRLNEEFHVPNEMIDYAIDPYESARMEYDADNQLSLMIFDIVAPTSQIATTEPFGIMFNNDQSHLLTFTRQENQYGTEYIKQIVEELRSHDAAKPDPVNLIVESIVVLAAKYLSAVLEINRRRTPIQRDIRRVRKVQSKIDELMDLQTDLIYILNSLETDIDLLNNFKQNKAMPLTQLQQERVDDALVELSQALDMGNLSQKVTASVSESYANLSNNDLNWTMKVLTVSSIVLTMPNIVYGYFGQNVPLPWGHSSLGWLLTFAVSVWLMGLVLWVLWRVGFLRK
ncbi:MAG: magnesium transporter CorA family protein [Lactobacillaceae bacterium]|jgi:Mg2+ and Co2+ transporter CorA|nr:magnesium transporter CorA family protein [Lactobacillaceae bacterium]